MIEDTSEEGVALEKIKTVAQKLSVTTMSEEEVAEFTKRVREKKK